MHRKREPTLLQFLMDCIKVTTNLRVTVRGGLEMRLAKEYCLQAMHAWHPSLIEERSAGLFRIAKKHVSDLLSGYLQITG